MNHAVLSVIRDEMKQNKGINLFNTGESPF